MFNETKIRFFYNAALYLSVQTISKEFYCFNEDFQDVQNFHFNDYDNSSKPTSLEFPVRVGVIIEIFIIFKMIVVL